MINNDKSSVKEETQQDVTIISQQEENATAAKNEENNGKRLYINRSLFNLLYEAMSRGYFEHNELKKLRKKIRPVIKVEVINVNHDSTTQGKPDINKGDKNNDA